MCDICGIIAVGSNLGDLFGTDACPWWIYNHRSADIQRPFHNDRDSLDFICDFREL
jgi:hypothetical protein